MKKLSKILVLILAFTLILTAAIVAISADNSVIDLASVIDETEADSEGLKTVVLKGNASVANYNLSGAVKIDLNGYTLTSTVDKAFIIQEQGVKFSIVGEGSINIAGMLVDANGVKDVEVDVIGQRYSVDAGGYVNTKGIDILHTGDAHISIVHASSGVWNFKNIDVVSTLEGGTTFKSFFMMDENKESTGAKMYFDGMHFVSDGVAANNPGQSVFQLSGKGYISIKNTQVYSSATILVGGFSNAESVDDVIIDVENSTLYSNPKYSTNRAFAMLFSSNSDWEGNKDVKGIVNIKNSYVNGPYRVFVTGHSDAEAEGGHDLIINAIDSYIQCGGLNNAKDAGGDFARGKKIKLNITGDSVYTSRSLNATVNQSVLTVGDGVRTNSASTPTFPEDGNYAMVYDPVGNKNYPYVVVKTHDAEGNAVEGASAAATYSVGTGNFLYSTGFEDVRHKASQNLDGWFAQDGKSATPDGSLFSNGEFGIKNGSFGETYVNGDSYIKYCVTPLDPDDPTETRKFAGEFEGNNDPFMVFGGKRLDDNTAYNELKYRYASGTSRAVVSVFDLDFATDSALGYTEFGVNVHSRMTKVGDAAGGAPITMASSVYIDNQGNIIPREGFVVSEGAPTKLNPIGQWNHITAVCYTDPAAPNGILYIFINGVEVGYTTLYSTSNAYIQGLRFNIANTIDQKVGSSIIFDNLYVRAYSDYIGVNEADGAGETVGYKDPSAYLLDFLTENKTSPVNRDLVSGGHTFANIDDAAAYANDNGTIIEYKGGAFPQDVNTDCTVYTNGATIPLGNNSVSTVITYDEEMNPIKYAFDSRYDAYKVNYYWFIGGEATGSALTDLNNYEKTQATLGQVPAPTIDAPEYKVIGGEFKKFTGWALSPDATSGEELVPVTMSFAIAQGSKPVYVYPIYEDSDTPEGTRAYVMAKDNALVGTATTDAETRALYRALKDGDTLVLTADFNLDAGDIKFENSGINTGVTIDNDYTADELAAMKESAAEIFVDVNGYKWTLTVAGNIARVSSNTTLTVYSSRAGGYIYSRAYDQSINGFRSQRMFAIFNGNESVAEKLNVYNAHINIGKATIGDVTYPGSNLTLNGGVIVEGITGDNSCSITADGIVAMRGVPDSTGMIMTRYYDGEITVKNSVLLSPADNRIIDLKSYDVNSTASNGRQPGFESVIMTPYVLIENTIIVNNNTASSGSTGDIAVNNGDYTGNVCLEYRNVLTNGRLVSPNDDTRNTIGAGVGAYNYVAKPNISGVKKATYNRPITFDIYGALEGVHIIAVQTPELVNADGGKVINDDRYMYVVEQGYEDLVPADAAGYIVLPTIGQISAYNSDIFTVTYLNFDGTKKASTTYAKGGIPKSVPIASVSGTGFTLTHDGTFSPVLPDGIQGNISLAPNYIADIGVEGLKANLKFGMNSEFALTLYVPASLGELVKSVTVGGAACIGEAVTVDGVNYTAYTVSVNADETMDDVVFTVNASLTTAKYGEIIYTEDVTLSIADYAEEVLKNEAGKFTDAERKLVWYAVNYANEAYKYFVGGDNSFDALLDEYSALCDEVAERVFAGAIETVALPEAIKSATFKLDASPKLVLTVAAGFEGKITVKSSAIDKEFNVAASETDTVIIVDTYASDLAADFTISVGDIEGTYNLATYAAYHTANREESAASAEALALIYALYDFVSVAA